MDEVKRDKDTIARNNLNPWYPCTPISVGSLARITNPCVSRGVSSRRLNWSFTPENTNFSNQSQCSLALRVPLVHMRKICTLHLSWPSSAASWPFALSQRRILRFVRLFFLPPYLYSCSFFFLNRAFGGLGKHVETFKRIIINAVRHFLSFYRWLFAFSALIGEPIEIRPVGYDRKSGILWLQDSPATQRTPPSILQRTLPVGGP